MAGAEKDLLLKSRPVLDCSGTSEEDKPLSSLLETEDPAPPSHSLLIAKQARSNRIGHILCTPTLFACSGSEKTARGARRFWDSVPRTIRHPTR